MSHRISRFTRIFLLLCIVGTTASAGAAATTRLSEQRGEYTAARQAIRAGNMAQYAALRRQLDDYPLAIYLDYDALARNLGSVSPLAAQQFLQRSADSPLALRFLGSYLRAAGKSARWQDFLQLMPEEPNSIDLKCYFFRAQLASGNEDAAWEGAGRLWVEGKSQPAACDPFSPALPLTPAGSPPAACRDRT